LGLEKQHVPAQNFLLMRERKIIPTHVYKSIQTTTH
jgi:hypothetical protein